MRLHLDLRRPRGRLEGEIRIRRMDVEIPVREFGDEARLCGQIAVGDDQPARQGLVGLLDPEFDFDAGRRRFVLPDAQEEIAASEVGE